MKRAVCKKKESSSEVAGLVQWVERAHIYLEVYASTQMSRVQIRPVTISCMSSPLSLSPLSHLTVLSNKGRKAQTNNQKKQN